MTMLELQKVLGQTIEEVRDGTADVEKAKTVASLAKQMINNSDIILRTDKFVRNDGKRIDKVVGSCETS